MSVTAGGPAQVAAPGAPQSAFVAAASRAAVGAARSTGPVPGVRLTVVVVTRPVRAIPTTSVVTGVFHERSTNRTASSPTLSTRCVLSSCIRRSRHPAYQFTAVSNVVRAALSLAESSEIWTAERAGSPFSLVALKRRIRVSPPPGSAFRAWRHGTTMPVPEELSEVRPSVQSRSAAAGSPGPHRAGRRPTGRPGARPPGSGWRTCATAPGRRRARAGRSRPGSPDAADHERRDRRQHAHRGVGTPPRGAGPSDDRRARAAGRPSTWARNGSRVRRASLDAMPRWRAYVAVAVCRARSAASRGQADLAGDVGERAGGEQREQHHLPLDQAELAQRVQRRAHLGVEVLVAVPDPGGVPALGVRPRLRPDGGLGVVEPGDLAPVVPGDDEGVAHRGPRRRAGRRSTRRSGGGGGCGRPCRTRRSRPDPSSGQRYGSRAGVAHRRGTARGRGRRVMMRRS